MMMMMMMMMMMDKDEDEDEDEMRRVRMKMKMGMMTLYQPEISSQGGGWVSNVPGACLFLAKARATSASTASFRDNEGLGAHTITCAALGLCDLRDTLSICARVRRPSFEHRQ